MTTTSDITLERFLGELHAVGETPAPRPQPALAAVLAGGLAPTTEVRDTRVPRFVRARRLEQRWARALLVPSMTGAVVFGGLATAGALPAPVQHATAGFAAHLGISLPGAHDSAPKSPIHRTGRQPASTAPAPASHTERTNHATRSTPSGSPPASPAKGSHTSAPTTVAPGVTTPGVTVPALPQVPLPLPTAPLPSVPQLTVPGPALP